MPGKRKAKWKPGPCCELRDKPNHWEWPEETSNEVLGFIYRIDELPTGKYYIGLKYVTPTSQPWMYYRGSSKPLHAAMDEYGYEKYKFTILFTCPSRSTLRLAEMQLQLDLDVLHDDNCYNLHIGGLQWCAASKHSAETREKLKRAQTGKFGLASNRFEAYTVGTCVKTGEEVWFCGSADLERAGFNKGLVSACISGKHYWDKTKSEWIQRTKHKGYLWRKEKTK